MKLLERLRVLTVAISAWALIAAMLVGPAATSADPVEGVVDQVGDTVGGVLGGGNGGAGGSGSPAGSPQPQGGTPPAYTPPAHGENPHGMGTVGVVDVLPEDAAPLPYNRDDPSAAFPEGSGEDIIVGQSRGEQGEDGRYRGTVTLASVSPLGIGIATIDIQTEEGETDAGPLDPLQQGLLDALCDGSGNQVCLGLLEMNSETTESGSQNSFSTLSVQLGGPDGITAGVAQSEGEIEEDEQCQEARGSSNVADASVGGALTADVLQSESRSRDCRDGSTVQENDSTVLNLGGQGLPIPPGCEAGDEQQFDLVLLGVACNADDSSTAGGVQLQDPYGVREALSVFVLPVLDQSLVKATTAASESHAAAPAAPPPPAPGPDGPAGPDGPPDAELVAVGAGPDERGSREPGAGERDQARALGLPLTGADLLTLALIGLGVFGSGLGMMALADRRRRLLRDG